MKLPTMINFWMPFVLFAFFFLEIFPLPLKPVLLILNTFPSFDVNETSYIDSFWDEISDVGFFFLISLHPPSPLILNTFPLFDLDETFHIDSFLDGICDVCISSSKFFPSPPLLPQNSPPIL